MFKEVKCKKCRKTIFNDSQAGNLFINAHCLPLSEKHNICETINDEHKLYVNEENIPDWIKLVLEAGEWSKGKINCQFCDFRIGGFNFISGKKCSCMNNVVPNIYIIKSKVDVIKNV